MEEIQENETITEPISENSVDASTQNEGQVETTPSELILGKFKSVDDLSKAYEELERFKGLQAQELGTLRQNNALFENLQKAWDRTNELQSSKEMLQQMSQKYNTPEYFQDQYFREIFKEAYHALGKNLDSDRLVNLLENYVASRIYARERIQSAQNETQRAVDSMRFTPNPSQSLASPKKRLDEMTPKEVDELLERII